MASLPPTSDTTDGPSGPSAAQALGLVYVDDFSRGYRRVGDAAKGQHEYLTPTGRRLVSASVRARLDAIGLPPAYQHSWYCPDPRGHIQAIGFDARGRKQYRYHPAWRAHADADKFGRCASFGRALPALRRRVDRELARPGLPRDRIIAAVVRLLDSGSLRVGNRQYAAANRSFGATTLRSRHVTVAGSRIRLRFVGKSGRRQDITLNDRRLAGIVRRCLDLPGQELFQYVDADGAAHPVSSGDINEWLRPCCGDFTAKSFRTWHASVIAYGVMAASKGQVRLSEVMALVAARLGNTPAVARKSYVHPSLVAILTGNLSAPPRWWHRPRATRWLSRDERGLLALLDQLGSASETD